MIWGGGNYFFFQAINQKILWKVHQYWAPVLKPHCKSKIMVQFVSLTLNINMANIAKIIYVDLAGF